ncbi:GNAT family N-acetyltransferase [Aliirhizobium terrae]|uniref:GNAT family N-acetyltransferase n=1 Tax=Terrirhizobium terrae TaxID=2926709 RepID=UPI0025788ACE|nr:GNAT family N-acetyltransferase [Rhizobium sp. CC-CFT758]WJH41611.1 GNAT family N-acetyltransferase [Rhizobium sp. CC-CFT758]
MNAAVVERTVERQLSPGPCPVIQSQRLTLRPHRLSDADAIASSLADFKVSRMLARVPQPFDRQDALDWLIRQTSGLLPDWNLAITTGDDVHIGVVAIELQRDGWHLNYWLNRYYWDRGYMTEATSAVLERFFRRMPEVTIRSGAFADNLASLNIQRKLGFRIVDAGEIFSLARNRMAPHIRTELSSEDFRRLPRA